METQNNEVLIPDSDNALSGLLNKKPKDKTLKRNRYANNAEYLEIGYLEFRLDNMFGAANWSWVVDSFDIKINAIFVSGHLIIKWQDKILKRAGIGAKEIQLISEKKLGTKALPIPEHIAPKALERDFPIASAQAFKNACKSLGNAFGRHLNRDFQYDFIEDKEATDLRLSKAFD